MIWIHTTIWKIVKEDLLYSTGNSTYSNIYYMSNGKNLKKTDTCLYQWITFLYTWNHDGMITHLEPDILECEVKWALGSITTNKTSGGDGILVELFQILKDDAVKVLHSICQQFGKLSNGHRTGNVSFHSNPKERQCQRILKLPHNCTHLTC